MARSPEDSQRDDDLALLRALCQALAPSEGPRGPSEGFGLDGEEDDGPGSFGARVGPNGEDQLQVFGDMLQLLEGGRVHRLSPKQRRWAEMTAERLDLDWGDPGKRNEAVPEGKPVVLLVDAMKRPLAPPGRR